MERVTILRGMGANIGGMGMYARLCFKKQQQTSRPRTLIESSDETAAHKSAEFAETSYGR